MAKECLEGNADRRGDRGAGDHHEHAADVAARTAALVAVGLVFPALRFASGLPDAVQALLLIGLMFAAGVVGLATFGFIAGPGIVLIAAGVLAVLFRGRATALVFVGLSVAAILLVGALVAGSVLHIDAASLDLRQMRNWGRVAVTFAFMSILLTTAIDFVIRRVENSSRAAAGALIDLRAAYDRDADGLSGARPRRSGSARATSCAG